MIKAALTSLHQQVESNQVSPEVMSKLDNFVAALLSKNSGLANAINADLTNSVWNQHKDWIKGLKYLILLQCKY